MKRVARKVLDSTNIDEEIARKAKALSEKTTIDDKLLGASKRFREEVRKNIATAILAAFGFMIALVWRDVVQQGVGKLVEYLHMQGDGYTFTVITAFVTTVVCVIGIIYFSRWGGKK
jgi:hypothetical protein